MKKLLFAGVALLATLSVAQAADIVEPAAYDWTGPYVGLQAGYGWGKNDVKADGEEAPIVTVLSSAVTFHPLDDGSIEMDGFVGGLHAGYNWQSDSLVLGVEGDLEYADLDGDTDIIHSDDGQFNEKAGDARQEIDWLGSLRLRAGFAFDRALIYATGGLAVGGVEVSGFIDESDFDDSNKGTEWGWTLGGGFEYAVTDELSARLEYRYTDLGNSDVEAGGEATPIAKLEFENTFHAVRAGLSWHFSP
ncbi:MAG TPA: outer membrane protein [Nordella sp.]|nr:outer membrane protein [Nordella sp.]